MTRQEEYELGQTEPRRVEGTTIGKAAVREFVWGLELRMTSPYEHPPTDGRERIANAAFHFFKWLAEVPGYGGTDDTRHKILTAWKTPEDEIFHASNMLGPGGDILGCCDIIERLHVELLLRARPRSRWERLRYFFLYCRFLGRVYL